MSQPKNKWTRPVSTKLRKKNTRDRSITSTPDYDVNSINSLESIDNEDNWSLVSAPESNSPSPTKDFEQVPRYIKSSEQETTTPSTYAGDLSEDFEEVLPKDVEASQHEDNRPSLQSRQASGSSEWSFIDAEPNRGQQEEPDKEDEIPKRPSITIEPHTPSCQAEASNNSSYPVPNPSQTYPHDYQGARSYWTEKPNLDALSVQLQNLKIAQIELREASRNHFREHEKQLNWLQNARWAVEASQDKVEKRLREVKQARASFEDLQSRFKAQYRDQVVQHARKGLPEFEDEESRFLFADVNARERAIVNGRGKQAQRGRNCTQTRVIEHPKTNWRGDFPYKVGTFIHRNIEAVYNEKGVRIGWDHKYMPSYKRGQLASQLHSKDELLMEIGKLPASERMDALSESEKFTQTVATEGKERKVETKYYTNRRMTELLEKERQETEIRHDSLTDEQS